MDLPVLMPGAAGVVDDHVVPLLVRTLPLAPGAVNPVPPLPAGSVPEAVDTFTGGRILERFAMLFPFAQGADYVHISRALLHSRNRARH
jgi:hypothetical protein